jgi:hypothetical protein
MVVFMKDNIEEGGLERQKNKKKKNNEKLVAEDD